MGQLKDKFPSVVTYIQFPFYAHQMSLFQFLRVSSKFDSCLQMYVKNHITDVTASNLTQKAVFYETWLISYKNNNK